MNFHTNVSVQSLWFLTRQMAITIAILVFGFTPQLFATASPITPTPTTQCSSNGTQPVTSFPNHPSPFFFTENKGQWDSRVLYKCQAKNGMTWFLERDGITLLLTQPEVRDSGFGDLGRGGLPRPPVGGVFGRGRPQNSPPELEVGQSCPTNENVTTGRGRPSGSPAFVGQTILSDDPFERDLPEMLRRHPTRYPLKAHALKFRFLVGDVRERPAGGSRTAPTEDVGRGVPRTPEVNNQDGRMPYAPTEAQSVEAQGELPWHNNYFLGNDSSKWAPNCRNFSTVVYREVWEGIDIEWYENEGKLEFDFIVHPGFDPNQIRMSVEGLEGDRMSGFGDQGRGGLPCPPELEVGHSCPTSSEATKQSHLDNGNREQDAENSRGGRPCPHDGKENVRDLQRDSRTTGGVRQDCLTSNQSPRQECRGHELTELRLQTSLGELRTALPSVYQISANGTRNEIEAAFQLTDQNTFGIILQNGHNTDHTLRIDPLVYSTFLGGGRDPNGSGNESGYAILNDGNGGVIVTGYTTSTNFPTTIGVIDPTFNGSKDCFVTRLNGAGSALIYSTYLGGITSDDHGYGITADSAGGVYITGGTYSVDFPTTIDAFDHSYNGGGGPGGDCFVARLNSDGSQLLYSSFFGGTSPDCGNAICGDGTGGVFVTGWTSSMNYPITQNAYDISYNAGLNDCFVMHLSNDSSQLTYSSYLGGSLFDVGNAIASDSIGSVFVTGRTGSDNFPTTPGAYDTSFHNDSIAGVWMYSSCFTTHLNENSSQLIYSTFIGDSSSCFPRGIICDGNGDVIIAGDADSHFPTTQNAFDTTYNGGFADCFVTCLNSTGTQLVFSTFLGGSDDDRGYGVVLDRSGNIIVTGSARSNDFPVTATAIQNSNQGAVDCFLTVLNNGGSQLLYSTYLGGTNSEGSNAIASDGRQGGFITGVTYSANFPTTVEAYDRSFNGGSVDCFIAHLTFDTTSVSNEKPQYPQQYLLSQNYPNPFNSTTAISYSLPKPGNVELKLFDLTGREVAALVNKKQPTGIYRVTFDGQKLSSGTYFVRMKAGGFVKTQKMVLLR